MEFNLPELARRDKKHLISALIQILAIVAIFHEEEWKTLINMINYDEKQILFSIINPIKERIASEMKQFGDTQSMNQYEEGEYIKHILQKLELKEKDLLLKNDKIEKLKFLLKRKDEEIQSLLGLVKAQKEEISEMNQIRNLAQKHQEDQHHNAFNEQEEMLREQVCHYEEKMGFYVSQLSMMEK